MTSERPYLENLSFLKDLCAERIKTIYTRIYLLNKDDSNQVDSLGNILHIEGICTAGSLSANNNSAIRRTGNLTIIANESNSNIADVDNCISMNKRIKIEIGIQNTLKSKYPDYGGYDIIWFPQGIFIITNASLSHSESGTTIQIQFKDKMVLLNGEAGGTLSGAITHSPAYVENADNTYTAEPVKIKKIIDTLLVDFGELSETEYIPLDAKDGKSPSISSKDVPDIIRQAIMWLDDTTPIYIGVYKDGETTFYDYSLVPSSELNSYPYQSVIGFMETDFTYPSGSDLTSAHGESICSVLDKIKNLLGNYEYFFDKDGCFHFQQIQNGLNEGSVLSSLDAALEYLPEKTKGDPVYSFTDARLVSSYQNSPTYTNVKNSFIVWGEKGETKTPIRYHLVLGTPPIGEGLTGRACKFKKVSYFIGEEEITYTRAYNINDKDVRNATSGTVPHIPTNNWRLQMYYSFVTGATTAPYAREFIEEFPKQCNIETGEWIQNVDNITYFFDKVETDNELVSQFNVGNIGYRLKTFKDTSINTLFAPQIQDLLFIEAGTENAVKQREAAIQNNQGYIQIIPEVARKIGTSTATTPAVDFIRSCLHQYLSYGTTVNLQCEPLYFLEPNTKIEIQNAEAGINGEFIINSISIPLTVDGKMSISASAAIHQV